MTIRPRAKLMTLLAVSCLSSQSEVEAAAITFTANYFNDAGLSAPDFAKFQSELGTALNYYSTTWEAPFAVNIAIDFHADNSVNLASASTFGGNVSYQDYRTALTNAATSTRDTTALAFIPSSPNNPVNGNSLINLTTPHARAVMGINFFPAAGSADAAIRFHTDIINLDRSGPIDPSLYDLRQVAYHEINEVMGFRSGLNGVANTPGPGPSGPIDPADLFRYDGVASRSWSTDINELQPYFSIDNGVTKLAEFDIDDSGDRQDFDGMINGSPAPSVQDAASTPGLRLDQGFAEETFLDVMGYNMIPEPTTGALLALSGLALLRRRRA